MLTKKLSLLAVVLIAGLMAFGATEVKAAPLFVGLDAPLECTAPIGGTGSVTVEAGKTQSGDVPYPQDVDCPDGSGTCSEFNLKFAYTSSPNHSIVSVSSDLGFFSCSPSCAVEAPPAAGDSTTKIGVGLHEQRTIRFNQNDSVFFAKIVMQKSVPRVGSAGGRIGTKDGTCLIGTAGIAVGDPNAIVASNTFFIPNTPESAICTVEVIRDAAGRVVAVRLTPEAIAAGCTAMEGSIEDIIVDGTPLHFAGPGGGSPNDQLTILGNTHLCQTYLVAGKFTKFDTPNDNYCCFDAHPHNCH